MIKKIYQSLFIISVLFFLLFFLREEVTSYHFGTDDFFNNHGIFFLFFIAIFPRLTLFFSSVVSGGILWWIMFFICPRLLIAILATFAYGQSNPLLVAISWGVAIFGEFLEKRSIRKRPTFQFKTFSGNSRSIFRGEDRGERESHRKNSVNHANTFEADYTVLKSSDEKKQEEL